MPSNKYPRLHDRRYALQQEVYRNTEIIRNGNWRTDSNELDALKATMDSARLEIAELDDVLDGSRLPITWQQLIQLLSLLVGGGLVLVYIVFTLGGR